VLLVPAKDWKVGFSYRSPFSLEVKDADVEIRNINAAVAGLFGGATSFDTKASTTVNMPATATLGVAYTANRLTLEVDADWTFWHSFSSLDITLTDQRPPVLTSTSSAKNWKDVVALYVGGEYRVTDPLALRLGFRYDPTPVPAETMGPELPDADKLYYSAGAGYKLRNWTFDIAYMYVDKKDRTVSNLRTEGLNPVGFNGTWTGDAHLVALDVGYRF
jgi:long-chain fatty acid transport protein